MQDTAWYLIAIVIIVHIISLLLIIRMYRTKQQVLVF